MTTTQQIFVVFYAIFWGAIASVQGHWKMFQMPLICNPKLRVVLRRFLLSFCVMNVLPVVYFGFTLWLIHDRGPNSCDSIAISSVKLVMQGVLPAFGIFALYRIWLGIIELRPHWFYKHELNQIPKKYWHVEPTYRLRWGERKKCNGKECKTPVVDLGEDTGNGNLLAALFYLVISWVVPWLFS